MLTQAACDTLSRYSRWMNERQYDQCASLTDAARREDRRAPFHSIHGTLNHLLLADRVWLGRFTGHPFSAKSLNQELYSDFEELRVARAATDAEIEAWVATLTEERLAADFTYTMMTLPQSITQPFWFTVQHFFNHQTHHRGQLTVLLEQAGVDVGVTDLLRVPGGPTIVRNRG